MRSPSDLVSRRFVVAEFFRVIQLAWAAIALRRCKYVAYSVFWLSGLLRYGYC